MKASKNLKLLYEFQFPRILLLLTFFFFISAISSCSKDEEQKEECCPECISPDGGEVEVTDASSYLNGTKIMVPAGEVNHCAEIWIDEHDFTYFPTGMQPFDDKKGLSLGQLNVPNAISMELHLPINDLNPEPTEIVCAFYTEGFWDKWHLVLPDEINDNHLVITTDRFHKEWSWGVVDLIAIDEEYIEPLLIEIHGEEDWALIKQKIEEVHNSIASEELDISCISLDIVYGSLDQIIIDNEIYLENFQAGLMNKCGYCNVTESGFYDEAIKRISLEIRYKFTELFVKKARGGITVKLLIWSHGLYQLYKIQKELDGLICDHGCFIKELTPEFKTKWASYVFANIINGLIDFGKAGGYIDCP